MPRFSREKNALWRLLACTTALCLVFPAFGAAHDLTFAGPGNDWFDPANWLGGSVPAVADAATVEGVTQVLIFGESAQAGRLIVADGADGSLLIRDPLATSSAVIGAQASASGAVTLSGTRGQWVNAQDIILGNAGSGAFDILEGATASAHDLRLGNAVGGAGALLIHGNGSRLTLGGTLEAGHAGSGAVTVSAGAWLASGGARFATLSGSSAALMVDRQGSTFSSGSLVLGEGGAAMLAITAGGAVEIGGDATFGLLSGGSGMANLSGEGSLLAVGGTLTLGGAGAGGLTLAEGAAATSLNARLGAESGGSGAAHLSGLGTRWVVTEHMDAASGVLSLEEAATLSTGSTTLGSHNGGSASAVLSGTGTHWRNGGALVVGEGGTGALTLEAGATLSTASAMTGVSAGGAGAVTVDGERSQLAVTGAFDIGHQGAGSLAVTAGGSVSAGAMRAGTLAGGTGAVTVDGEGSQLAMAGAFDVGHQGAGSLAVTAGASASAGSMSVGTLAGGTGAVTVDGEGSQLVINGAFDIGHQGAGSLAVTAGGSVSAGSMGVGTLASGTGAVTVDGEGSQLAVAGAFDIGRFGAGSATLSGGAVLTAGSVTIAAEAGSSGVLNIGAEESALAAGAGRLETAAIHFGAGDGALVLNHGETDYELSAALSGTGAIRVLRGTTILTGNNNHEGLTTIASGATLAIGDGGTRGTAGAASIVNDGALVFNRAGETAFTGAISGTGTLTKQGSGLLTLSGDSTYGGATTVAAGRLDVAGSLTSAISVESGASLGGGGQSGGVSIASGGTLFTEGLSVSGDLSLASGSTLAAVLGAPDMGTVSASGAVSLDGVALALTYDPGGTLSNHYTLVEGASLSGGFNTLSVSGLSSRFSLTNSMGDGAAEIALAYDASTAALSGMGANGVHERIAAAFDRGETLAGPLAAALAADGEGQQSAMAALSGESGASAAILAPMALSDFLGAAGSHTASENETALWTRMTGTSDRFAADTRKGTGAARTHLAGLEGGARHALNDIWSGGISLSLGAGHYAPEGVNASATGRYGQAALSLSGRFSHGAYLSAAAGFSLMDLSTRRNLTGGERLEGDFTARTAGLDLESGVAFTLGETVLTPFAGVSLIHLHAPSYRETAVAGTGSAALDYAALDQWSGAARLGLEAAHQTALGENPLSLRAKLTYLRHFSGSGRRQAGFSALSGGYFDLESLTREGDALSLSAGAVLTLTPSSDVTLDLGGDWSRQGHSLTGSLGVNWRW